MRKVRFTLGVIGLLILIFPAVSSSQITYVMNPSAPFSYISLPEEKKINSWTPNEDDGYFDLPLGDFVFQFYGVPVTTLRISTNGYMTFGRKGRNSPTTRSPATPNPMPSLPLSGQISPYREASQHKSDTVSPALLLPDSL